MVATAAGLLMSLVIFVLIFLWMYQNTIGEERKEAVNEVNQLLRVSLENAMLKRDLEGLRSIVISLGQQQNIVNVMISNPAGEIRFASSDSLLGTFLKYDKLNKNASTRFVNDYQDREVLRSTKPVYNKQPCTECHGPVENNPVNGILYIDYDAASLRHNARQTTLILMGSGGIIVLINIAGGWWFIRRFVLKPVANLASASDSLRRGELATRVQMEGEDELSLLGHTFNRMAEALQENISELAESEAFLQALVDGIPDGVRIIDSNYNVLLVNKSYKEQLGLPETHTPGYCYEGVYGVKEPCVPTLTTCPIHEIKKHGKPIKVLHHHIRHDGSNMDVEIYAAPLNTEAGGKGQLIVESIRDLEKAVKYSQEQKLSEIGRLATGVAHEIYNPLASVRFALNESQNALAALDTPTDEVSSYLQMLEKEVTKCVDVTGRLLKLSGPSGGGFQLVSIASIVHETISLLYWEAEEKNIKIVENYQEGLRVHANDSEMRMITLNIVQNAFHAMPDGGTLEVTSSSNNDEIVVCFKDNGTGIKPGELKKIFDPFFSCRADGSFGTGLGLPIARTIMKNHGGKITVSSQPGEGSSFNVHLSNPDDPKNGNT